MKQKEHLACCQKSLKEKSTVAKHAWELDLTFKWKESKLITPVSNLVSYFARKVRESIEIYKHQTIQQEGRTLNYICIVLFVNYIVLLVITYLFFCQLYCLI